MKQSNVFRKIGLGSLLLVMLFGAFPAVANPQQEDPSVRKFWSKFKAAVQKSDKASVAAMSQFPIEMPYGVAKIRNRTQLTRRWRDLFSVQTDAVKCFGEAQPVQEREGFSVGCKDAAGNEVVVYGFVFTKMGWKLKYLDNINE